MTTKQLEHLQRMREKASATRQAKLAEKMPNQTVPPKDAPSSEPPPPPPSPQYHAQPLQRQSAPPVQQPQYVYHMQQPDMNNYVRKLNLENTNFANPHGLPNKANLSTAYDIFKLSSRIIIDFPEHLHRFKKTKVKIKGKNYTTHNTLLKKYDHYIGLKTGYTRKSGFQISLLSINDDKYLLGIYFGGNSAKERNNKINFLMNKYRNKDASKNEETKKLTVKNETKNASNYTVQTSSFKKISKSKMHITLLKNKIKILRSFEHQIKKNGRYFISYINVDDQKTAKNLCNEIKLNKLDCLIKAS